LHDFYCPLPRLSQFLLWWQVRLCAADILCILPARPLILSGVPGEQFAQQDASLSMAAPGHQNIEWPCAPARVQSSGASAPRGSVCRRLRDSHDVIKNKTQVQIPTLLSCLSLGTSGRGATQPCPLALLSPPRRLALPASVRGSMAGRALYAARSCELSSGQ
jgi:hypothetical protein